MKKYNTILRATVLTIAIGLFDAVANDKIDAKRDSRAPEAVRNAPIVGEFQAKRADVDAYHERKRLSKQKELEYVEDHYIVRFNDNVFPYAVTGKQPGSRSSEDRRILQLLSEQGMSLQEVSRVLVDSVGGELITVYQSTIEGFAAYIPKDKVEEILKDPLVKTVRKDGLASYFQTAWHLDRIDESDLPLDSNYHPAKTGSGVHIYILDSGLRSTHDEFEGRVGTGYSTSFSNTNDDVGHGTATASCAAGETLGVAPQATIHPVKVGGAGGISYADVIDGVEWVENNHTDPAVANISLGGGQDTDVDDAVQSLIDAGVTVTIAAGNSKVEASSITPARVVDALTIASTEIDDDFAVDFPSGGGSGSNFGSRIDFLAPGENVTVAWKNSDSHTIVDSGTSYSAPYVAGAVALFLQDNPTATPAQVRAQLVVDAVNGTIASIPSGGGKTITPNRFLNIVHTGIDDPPAPSNVVISILWPFPIFSLSWNDDASNETHYVIERSTNLVNWSEFDRTFANVESEVNGLPSGTSFFRLRADSHAGMGSFTFASSGGSPPPGSVTIYSSDGSGDIYYNDYSQTVNVPSGGVASAYVDALSDTYNSYASAEVSGQGEYIYADASGSYEYDSFDGASSGSYYLYADHYSDGWDYAEGSAHIDW